MTFKVEVEQEEDGRWIKVQALALRVVADRLEHGEARFRPEDL